MDYKKIHDAIIDRSFNRTLYCYTEKHHIIPKCMGGGDEKTNIAILTPEEHFVIHQLLIKIYPNIEKLVFAARMMILSPNQEKKRINNKDYSWLKKKHSKVCSSTRKGENNPFYGKRHSTETLRKNSEAHIGKKSSKETREKLSKIFSGEGNPNFGKPISPEQLAKTYKQILQIDKDTGEVIKEWVSQGNAARNLKIKQGDISNVCLGKRKTCGGFVWRFKES